MAAQRKKGKGSQKSKSKQAAPPNAANQAVASDNQPVQPAASQTISETSSEVVLQAALHEEPVVASVEVSGASSFVAAEPPQSAASESSDSSFATATATVTTTQTSTGSVTAAEEPVSSEPVEAMTEKAPNPNYQTDFGAENFKKDEIRSLLVPVKPFHRLIACAIVILCYSLLGHMLLKGVPSVNAHGMHEVDLPEPGAYVLFFRGDLVDPYGWARDGRFRNSLEIDMEPIEPFQKVNKIEQIKDISGANFFSVAEFEVNQPGKYNLWIKWNKPEDRCKGKIYIEKDPVEKSFFKWAVGIVGTIALFFMIGIPMTTQKAQSTLPSKPPES